MKLIPFFIFINVYNEDIIHIIGFRDIQWNSTGARINIYNNNDFYNICQQKDFNLKGLTSDVQIFNNLNATIEAQETIA